MKERATRDNNEVQEERSRNPDDFWTIESKSRATSERKANQKKEENNKYILNHQLQDRLATSVRERSRELAIGQEICRLDKETAKNEQMMRDFKRERFSKAMRDAW